MLLTCAPATIARSRAFARTGHADGRAGMTNGPTLTGFLTFADRPKADAAAPITELERLGVHHQGGAPHRKGRGISTS